MECVDGYYCRTCGKLDDEGACESPLSEVDISWDIAIVTLREAAKMYAASKTGDRLFCFNPETIERTADKLQRFYTERHQRWQIDSMRGR
jgi:hypothetical protein